MSVSMPSERKIFGVDLGMLGRDLAQPRLVVAEQRPTDAAAAPLRMHEAEQLVRSPALGELTPEDAGIRDDLAVDLGQEDVARRVAVPERRVRAAHVVEGLDLLGPVGVVHGEPHAPAWPAGPPRRDSRRNARPSMAGASGRAIVMRAPPSACATR